MKFHVKSNEIKTLRSLKRNVNNDESKTLLALNDIHCYSGIFSEYMNQNTYMSKTLYGLVF